MKIKNKVFIVTGGGNGIGREVVLQLLNKGARVAALDINEQALQDTVGLAGELKEKLSIHITSITDKSAVEALPQKVAAIHGAVDGLINVAGIIQKFVPFKSLDFTEIERVMNINFWGTLYMVKAFLPYLLARPEANITNVSSMGGFFPVPGQTLYGASKAAVKLFTEGLNSELHETNVHVTIVFPGAIGTNIASNSGVSIGGISAENSKIKLTSAKTAGEKIIAGIEKNKYRVLIGSDARMMDLFYRLMPRHSARIIYQQMKSILPQ